MPSTRSSLPLWSVGLLALALGAGVLRGRPETVARVASVGERQLPVMASPIPAVAPRRSGGATPELRLVEYTAPVGAAPGGIAPLQAPPQERGAQAPLRGPVNVARAPQFGPPPLARTASSCDCQGGVNGACGVEDRTRILDTVGCPADCCEKEPRWRHQRPIPWEVFGPGEYVGPARTAHIGEYRLRPLDQLTIIYLQTRDQVGEYELEVGDELRIESPTDAGNDGKTVVRLERTLTVIPDGTIHMPMVGRVMARGRTIAGLKEELDKLYVEKRIIRFPDLTLTPTRTGTKLTDILSTVDSRQGIGGTSRQVTIAPDGVITLAGVEQPICCQGLTVTELQQEINSRYMDVVKGLQVTVTLTQHAPTFFYVLGEVAKPDRYQLSGPTRLAGALAMAGGVNLSGNQRQIIVMRRTDDWGVIATRFDLRGTIIGKRPCPSDDIWIRDGDVVIVPKHAIQQANDVISLIFTNGLYQFIPRWGTQFGGRSLL